MRYPLTATTGRRCFPAALAAILLAMGPVRAGGTDDAPEAARNPESAENKSPEIGVRFTPAIAEAVSDQFMKQMTERYELDDKQAGKIRPIMIRQFSELANGHATVGRDFIEHMIATTIRNEGRFSLDDGPEFARKLKPLFPILKEFFAETSGEFSKEMSLKQRLKFTGDMAGVTAGLLVLETRMNRWEKGEVRSGANPFFDRSQDDPESAASDPVPEDPNEHPDHRKARQRVESRIGDQIDVEGNWEKYIERTIEYFDLEEAQQESARAILKECVERLSHIKTPELRAAMTENRIARRLTWGTKSAFSQGPWMHKLEKEYEKLRKPVTDLTLELKGRVESLPNSRQRALAEESVRRALEKKGMGKPPV